MSACGHICHAPHFPPEPCIEMLDLLKRGSVCLLTLELLVVTASQEVISQKPGTFGLICMQTENLVFNPVWPQFSLMPTEPEI